MRAYIQFYPLLELYANQQIQYYKNKEKLWGKRSVAIYLQLFDMPLEAFMLTLGIGGEEFNHGSVKVAFPKIYINLFWSYKKVLL